MNYSALPEDMAIGWFTQEHDTKLFFISRSTTVPECQRLWDFLSHRKSRL